MRRVPRPSTSLLALCLLAIAAAGNAFAAPAPWMPRAEGTTLRVLSWNVAREQFFESPERTARLLRQADPDVLLLDEMDPAATPEALTALLDSALPGLPWQAVLGREAGNRERGSIAARVPLRRVEAFDALHYRAADQADWIARGGAHAERLRRQLPNGVAAAAAIADYPGLRLLLVSFDLQCCGDSPDSWEERRRQREAALIRAAFDLTLADVDAAVVGGDANAVQGDAPLRLLSEGRPPLLEVAATREDGSDWTWDGRGTPFPSGRLDRLWVTPGVRVLQARLLDTEGWSERERRARGVREDDSRTQSPHRPIVADLALP